MTPGETCALCTFLFFILMGLVITGGVGRERYESLNNAGMYIIGEECKVPVYGGVYMFTSFDGLQEHPYNEPHACVFKPMAGAGLLDANMNACAANSHLFSAPSVRSLDVEGRNCVVRFKPNASSDALSNYDIYLRNQSALKSAQYQKLNAKLQESIQKEAAVKREVAEMQAAVRQVEQEKAQVDQTRGVKINERESARARLRALQGDVDSMQSEVARLQSQIQGLQGNLADAQRRVAPNSNQRLVIELQNQLASLQAALRRAQEALKVAQEAAKNVQQYNQYSDMVMVRGYDSGLVYIKTLAQALNSRAYTSVYNSVYNGGTVWQYAHDRDLNSNVWWAMGDWNKTLVKVTLVGGQPTSVIIVPTYSASSELLGASYVPQMCGIPSGNGAFIVGGFMQNCVHVLEFNSNKSGIAYSWTVPYKTDVYGVQVIPRQDSGFSTDFGYAYSRAGRTMCSWVVDMARRSWTSRYDTVYSPGVTGPHNGLGVSYIPPGTSLYASDPNVSYNRLAMNDTSSTKLFIYRITQSGTRLDFQYAATVDTGIIGGCITPLTSRAYSAHT
jgi:hypothetical protein